MCRWYRLVKSAEYWRRMPFYFVQVGRRLQMVLNAAARWSFVSTRSSVRIEHSLPDAVSPCSPNRLELAANPSFFTLHQSSTLESWVLTQLFTQDYIRLWYVFLYRGLTRIEYESCFVNKSDYLDYSCCSNKLELTWLSSSRINWLIGYVRLSSAVWRPSRWDDRHEQWLRSHAVYCVELMQCWLVILADYDLLPCASDPCKNNGRCITVATTTKFKYRCNCTANYTGDKCESGMTLFVLPTGDKCESGITLFVLPLVDHRCHTLSTTRVCRSHD